MIPPYKLDKLLSSPSGSLRVDKFCRLHWDGEKLEMRIGYLTPHDLTVEIKARDWQGITAEVKAAQLNAYGY